MPKSKYKKYHGHVMRQCPFCGLKMISRQRYYEYHVNLCAKSSALRKQIAQDEERDK